MTKLFSLLLPLCAVASSMSAQAAAPPPPADTARVYKHHLGLTASPVLDGFFRNNRSLPVGLLYKRQVTPRRAWRYGAVFNQQYTQRYDPQPKTNNAYTYQSLGLGLTVGQEWQRPLTKRWVGYVGLDVGAGYQRDQEEKQLQRFVTVNGADVVIEDYTSLQYKTYSGFLRPLVGLRYYLMPFLYASVEVAVKFTYSHQRLNGNSVTSREDTGEVLNRGTGKYQERYFQTALRPLEQVTLHYLFGHK